MTWAPRVTALLAALLLCACGEPPRTVEGSSSDGVVFVRMQDGQPDLARGRLSDGSVVSLIDTPDRDETWPYWSELSRRLVFQVGPLDGRGHSDLVLWLPRSGQEIPVTQSPRRSERWPVWSPTQQRLVFAFAGARNAGLAVFDMEARGARLVGISPQGHLYMRPTFSPDGGRMVVQRRGEGARGSNLWMLEEGQAPVQLTFEPRWFDTKAWFTRDAEHIVYTRRPSGGDGWFELAMIPATGGEPTVLVKTANSDNHSARPSPTRDEIAFVSDRAGDFDVYLMSEDGASLRNLTNTPDVDEFAPRWSADGQRLLVTVAEEEYGVPRLSDRDSLERSEVRVLSRDGEVLFTTPGLMPDWMPPW